MDRYGSFFVLPENGTKSNLFRVSHRDEVRPV